MNAEEKKTAEVYLKNLFDRDDIMIIQSDDLDDLYVCLGGYELFNEYVEEIDPSLNNTDENVGEIRFEKCCKVTINFVMKLETFDMYFIAPEGMTGLSEVPTHFKKGQLIETIAY